MQLNTYLFIIICNYKKYILELIYIEENMNLNEKNL